MRHEYKKIVTHGGQAHNDDTLSLACLLRVLGFDIPVFRRDPTPEELDDPSVLVVDVGMSHDPRKGNYDHHQLGREAPAACALTLLIDDKEGWPELQVLTRPDWVKRVAVFDSKGPFAYAKANGFDPSIVFLLGSRVEQAIHSILEKFSGEEQLPSRLVETLGSIGAIVLDEAEEFARSYDRLMAAPRVEVGGVLVLVNESEDTMASQKVREDLLKEGVEIAALVSYDDRGPGWALYRFSDHPSIDFSRLEGREEVVFAHRGGFIAKTKGLGLDEVLSLVADAIKESHVLSLEGKTQTFWGTLPQAQEAAIAAFWKARRAAEGSSELPSFRDYQVDGEPIPDASFQD